MNIILINRILSIILTIISAYIIAAPFSPDIEKSVKLMFDKTKGYEYQGNLSKTEVDQNHIKAQDLKPIPKENTLVIPKIAVDARIFEGEKADTLNKGIWRRPKTSTPDKGGNTVLTGHRYLYTSGPNTFYSLDKLEIGDRFAVYWQGKEYDYEVYETKVVKPTETEIENNTTDPIITLYTCTPLWTAENRLVVRGKPIKI